MGRRYRIHDESREFKRKQPCDSFTQVDNIMKCVFNKGSEYKIILDAQIIHHHMKE
jgi:hypothetical protein